MALQYQMIPINLTGIDQKTDDFVLQPGALTELKNCWMDRTGKLQKRYGFDELASAQADAVAVSGWYDDVLRWRDNTAEIVESGTVKSTNIDLLAGSYETFDIGNEIPLIDDFTDEFSYAEGPDYGIFVKPSYVGITEWIDVQFIDLESRKCFYNLQINEKTIAGPTTVDVTRAQVVATATGVAMVMWTPYAASQYILVDHWVGFSGGVPTRSFENVIADSGKRYDYLDVVHIDGWLAIAYNTTADTYLARVDITNQTAATAQISTDAANVLSLAKKTSTTGVLIWQVATGAGPYALLLKRRDFDVTTGPTGTATTIVNYTGVSSFQTAKSVSILWDGSVYHTAWDWPSTAVVASGSYPGPGAFEYYISSSSTRQALDYRAQLASRLFQYDSQICLYQCSLPVPNDDTNVSLALRTLGSPPWPKWSDVLFQGRTRPGSPSGSMPEVIVSGTTITTALPYSGNRKRQAKLVVRSATGKPTFNYWNGVLMHNVTPHLSYFDGYGCFPAGFPTWPVINSVTPSGSGSFSGEYGFTAVWERIDNQGNVWRSAPSLIVTATASSHAQFDINIEPPPFYQFDSIDDDFYQIVIYRTTANGSIYYRAYSEPAEQATVIISDTLNDSTLASKPLLYTDGGGLENIMPPAVEAWVVARDRIFLISAEDGDVYPSKLRISGEGLGFNDALRISLNGKQDLKALGAMDEKVLIFGEETTQLLYGVGPDDLGAGQYEIQQISDDIGCIEPRSVMLGDAGLYFQSLKGLWRWGRDLSSNPVGIPVDTYKDDTIVGAMSPSDRLAHWWFLDTGTILVWDEYHQIWSRFLTSAAKSSAIVNQKPVFLTSTGQVFEENTSSYQDNGADYEQEIYTGWLNFAGLQGFQKVRRISILGESQTAAFDVVVTLAYDFVDTTVSTFTAANATVKPAGTAYQWEFKPGRQKCESLRIKITSTSSGAGASIVGLAFEAGRIPGIARRLKTAKRVEGT